MDKVHDLQVLELKFDPQHLCKKEPRMLVRICNSITEQAERGWYLEAFGSPS